ncbi:MAG TPA: hypothetical protein VN730_07245 [Steroidobacteraceae bacterium]|nr:hypothetical protein [Steroidobacteraceae bacterium]
MTRTSARREFFPARVLATPAILARPTMPFLLGAALLCFARLPHAAAQTHAAESRCLTDGSGYLRVRLRGALAADLDWHNNGLECEGGMRPDGHGIRVSFAGPLRAAGTVHRLRFIFGIEAAGEGRSGRALPANVTLILEGERRIFSTRGDNQCTIDDLRQEPLGHTARHRDYRVAARGFCVGPATSLTGSERVLVSRFDFSGRITLDDAGSDKPNRAAKPNAETTAAHIRERKPFS